MFLHLPFTEQWSEPCRATINPFPTFAIFEEHLNETGIDGHDASVQPFAVPFGDHASGPFHLYHWPLRFVLFHVVLNEMAGGRMHVVPHIFGHVTNQSNVVVLHVLSVAIVEENQIAPIVVALQRFGHDARIE